MTLWGDYVGSIAERVNSDYILNEFPESVVVTAAGNYGTTHIQLAPRVTSSDLAELIDLIEQFEWDRDIAGTFGYSGDRRSELEGERIRKDIVPIVAFHLSAIANWKGNTLITDSDLVFDAIMEAEPICYFETATDFVFDVEPEFYPAVAQRMLADYAASMGEALHVGIEPLIPEHA